MSSGRAAAVTQAKRTGRVTKLAGQVMGGAPATTLEAATFQMPDGQVKDYAIVHRPVVVGVIALRVHDGELELLLVEQVQPAVRDEHVLEVVSGQMKVRDEGDPRRTAARELKWRAGVRAQHWRELGSDLYPSPEYSDEVVHVWAAWGLTDVARGTDEPGILPLWLPLPEAVLNVVKGTIRDLKTRDAIWSVQCLHEGWEAGLAEG